MQEVKKNAEVEEDTQHGKYLTFSIGGDVYGIEIRYVMEIIGIQPITAVPKVPEYVKGIINLRGRIIPVIDIRIRFGREPVDYNERTSIIIVEIGEVLLGMIVDRVAEVITISDENIVPPPAYCSGAQNRFVKAIGKVGKDVKLLIGCEKLVQENDIADCTQQA